MGFAEGDGVAARYMTVRSQQNQVSDLKKWEEKRLEGLEVIGKLLCISEQ